MPLVQDFLRPYARLATTNRLVLYGVLSTLAVSLVILNAFKNYSNFYSVAVYLSRSNRSVMFLANFAVLGALLVGRGLQHVLFGSLRANEVERLYDRIWFFLTESLLAFTIFRNEFDVSFCIMFGFLLFVKCFHWLMSFRIEWMDQIQYPGPNVWFHVRMNILFLFLWCIDIVMLCFAIESILVHGIGGIVLFASEYAILMASALNSMSKYFIIFYDIRRAAARGGENAPVWEDKSMFIFYVELVTDFLKLITYLTFFLLVLTFYGLPLNIVRDVYLTARSFINRCRDLVRYRTATRNMDERYPNATEDELTRMTDRTCIICREEMVFRNATALPPGERTPPGVNDTPKKLPCGHVFHFHCLRSWLERQQSCPTCRRTVLENRPSPQNIGAQGPPRAPPAPQPGAVPQMQGFGAPVAAQQQQQPGLIARILGGIAGAAPVVPGQFAHGPAMFNQQQAPLNNQPPPPQGFPAQNPFGPWQQPGYYVPAQQGPAPVQVLQGFYIGNQWQPWGAPPQVQQGRPQQPRVQTQLPPGQGATTPQPHAAVAQPQPQLNSAPATPTYASSNSGGVSARSSQPPRASGESSTQGGEITEISEPPRAPSSSASSSASAELPSPSSTSTPTYPNLREAAGLPALHRLGSKSASPALSSPTAITSDSTSYVARAGQSGRNVQVRAPTPPASTTVPDPPGNTGTSTAGESTSIPSTAQTATPNPRPSSAVGLGSRPARTPVPSLIPLFDPITTSATIVPPPGFNRAPLNATSPYQLVPNGFPPPFNPQHQQRPRQRPADTNTLVSELMRGTNNLPEMRSLPQNLTEEQLNRLDTLTREAIDERLRALENVQNTMWRCIEELVRVRSVLPSRPGGSVGSPAQEPFRNPDKASEDPNDKGKAKATVPEDVSVAATGPSGSVADPVLPPGVQVEVLEDASTLVTEIGEVPTESVQ